MIRRVVFGTRTYQRPAREARAEGCRRFIKLWHRRAGKDRDSADMITHEAMRRPGVYFHLFPSLNQGRRDFWDNRVEDPKGSGRFYNMIDTFPPELIVHRDDKEMQIIFVSGAIYQIMGADDRDAVERLRGPNPVGMIFSEYASHHWMKEAWSVLRPVLAENDGFAIFAYTPKGLNHGYTLWKEALADPFHPTANPLGWFTQLCTVDDTRRDAIGEPGTPVMTPEMIAHEAKTERPEFIRQEYYCDFTGFEHGTIYGDLMRQAEEDIRVTEVGYIPNYPVGVLFDLGSGKTDAIAMWFYQVIGGMKRFIDYEEALQKNMAWVAQLLRERKPYIYGRLVLPWDGKAAEEYLTEVGFRNVVAVEHRTSSVQASIEVVRREFSTMVFDRHKCARGIECLQNYKRKYDEERKVFEAPVHDQYSHGADALRTGVEGGFEPLIYPDKSDKPVTVIHEFDPRIPI